MATLASINFIGAVKDEWVMYSNVAEDYTIKSPIGFGASSVVYEAVFHRKDPDNPKGAVVDIPCALKVLDLDTLPPSALKLLTRETQMMSLSKHPNVLRVRGSWMVGHKLFIAMRLMNKGSIADVMKYSFIDGLEEEVVKCILQQALQGLNYLHVNGFIHRDIKAANFLIDDDGTVLLGDLGVAVSLADDDDVGSNGVMGAVRRGYEGAVNGGGPLIFGAAAGAASSSTSVQKKSRLGKRKSFVGTPCWMAPEVISQQHYDSSADIWSFGITALELCCGRAPGSRERDLKRVLLSTLNNAPPTLDREGGKYKYSKALKDMVESCLVKDPTKRPNPEQLLQHPFFKNTKKKGYLVNTLLSGLPPLSRRQERRLVDQPKTKGGSKHGPLGTTPSVVSLAGARSWDWTWSIAGSPRSTFFQRDGNTPPASIRGGMSTHSGGPGHVFTTSPSSSVISLHGNERHSQIGKSSSSTSFAHHKRDSSVGSGMGRTTSPVRHLHPHPRGSTVPIPHMDMSVFEMEGEDDLSRPLYIKGRTNDLTQGQTEEERGRRGSDNAPQRMQGDSTPMAQSAPLGPEADNGLSGSPTELLLQPPELSSSLSSAQVSSSPGPGTPSQTSSSVHSNAVITTTDPVSGSINKPSPVQNAPTLTKKPEDDLLARRTSTSNGPTIGKSGKKSLWKKVKSAASSSSTMSRGSSNATAGGYGSSDDKENARERKSGFGAFLDRTVSRSGKP